MKPTLTLLTALLLASLAAMAAKPNVVHLYADDAEWGDIRAHGGTIARRTLTA